MALKGKYVFSWRVTCYHFNGLLVPVCYLGCAVRQLIPWWPLRSHIFRVLFECEIRFFNLKWKLSMFMININYFLYFIFFNLCVLHSTPMCSKWWYLLNDKNSILLGWTCTDIRKCWVFGMSVSIWDHGANPGTKSWCCGRI